MLIQKVSLSKIKIPKDKNQATINLWAKETINSINRSLFHFLYQTTKDLYKITNKMKTNKTLTVQITLILFSKEDLLLDMVIYLKKDHIKEEIKDKIM